MPSRILVILAAGVVAVALGAGAWFVLRPAPAPIPAAPGAASPAAAEGSAPAVQPPPPAREASPPSRRTAPTPPATRDAAPPAEAPPAPAVPTTGTLVIESDVPDTKVFVDRVSLGTAPVTARDLTPGPHRLNMSAPGYEMISEEIEVEPGTRTLSISFREVRLDASIPVVHKHGMGSCRGELRATPEGIRYDTTHESDSFTVTFANLQQFEVNYLEGNLRIRTAGNRTFNFGDSDGNSDRLYAFHQEVDKVRQRIRGPSPN